MDALPGWEEEVIDIAHLTRAEVNGTIRDWKTGNVYYRSCHYHKVKEEGSIRVQYDERYIQLLFLAKGTMLETSFESAGVTYSLLPGQFILFVHPAHEPRSISFPKSTDLEVCVVNMRPDYFFKTLYNGMSGLQQELVFGKAIGPLCISAEIQRCLQQINQIEVHGQPFKPGLLEARIQELVLIALEIYHRERTNNAEPMAECLYDKITAIGQLLAEHPDQNFTLEQLAQRFTCNTTFIKQHFKKVYGRPVSGYVTMLRMKRALELLRVYDLSIAAIAEQVGYKHSTHFTVAFKRYYGLLPKAFRDRY